MNKKEAAEKLVNIFGDMNVIGVLHSIIVETSKYIIIILFAVYTWHCFTVFFGNNNERKEKVYKRQRGIMYTIHFICSLVLYLNSLDVKIIMYYFIQLVFLIFVGKSYSYIYKGMSKTVLNNMLMLMTTGFIMLERLGHGYVTRQMAFAAAICFAGLFIPYIIDKFTYFDKLGWIYAVVGIVLLALVFVIGQEKYGAKNWIIIGSFALQPSEFVKIIFVFFVAALFAKSSKFIDIAKVTVLAAVHVLILVAEKDLGAALIFYITYIVLLFVASRKPVYLAAGLMAGCIAAVAAYNLFSHVQTRVIAWSDPWSYIDTAGYQVAHSLFAIGTGGWFGMGLGEGMPGVIPVAESDFIFSAICEELGFFFGICIILIEISCFIMFINISLKMAKRFYKLVALGLSIEYIFQVFLTIGGVTKFIPSTGVTLPLVSYGGSSIISTVILFNIIQGLYVLNGDREEQDGKKEAARRKAQDYRQAERTGRRRRAQ